MELKNFPVLLYIPNLIGDNHFFYSDLLLIDLKHTYQSFKIMLA